jgi:hypothetical protein
MPHGVEWGEQVCWIVVAKSILLKHTTAANVDALAPFGPALRTVQEILYRFHHDMLLAGRERQVRVDKLITGAQRTHRASPPRQGSAI